MTKRDPLEPGTFYHLYQRGNNRERIFFEQRNYAYFLQLVKKHISPVAKIYAYCLLSNHFHFLIQIHEESELPERYKNAAKPLYQPFSNWLNAYSKAINKAYNRTGKLFEERFKRRTVREETYLINLVYYIHANPQKHGIIHDFRQYPHSSFRALTCEKPSRLQREPVWNWFGGKKDFLQFHEQYHEYIVEMDWE